MLDAVVMRTHSLAIGFAATLIACSGHDDPAPAGDQTAAVVAPTQPAAPAAPATPAPASDEKQTDAPAAKTDAPPTTDESAFAALAQKLNDCISACKEATCGSACLSDFQANLPKAPDVPSTSGICCAGTTFFVCHAADGGDTTCGAKNPGPNCQAVPAMDVICKGAGDQQ